MNSLLKKLFVLSVGLASAATAYAAAPTGDKHGDMNRLRYSRYRQQSSNGLYSVPKSIKPSLAPLRISTEGRPELIANCTSKSVGYGMYSFYPEQNLTLNSIAEIPAFFGGAVYVNGKYYGADYDYDDNYDLTYVRWYVYDALTWHCDKMVENPLDYSYIATDRTYDTTTGKVYSICYDKTGESIWLATTSLSDGASTLIAALDKEVIMIAADASGRLFGIDTEANLYRIDKNTAALTLIGNTNIYEGYQSTYTQSITFDNTIGKLYWAEFHSEGMFRSKSALYEVDPATAATVKIADLPGNPEMIGMYVADYMQPGVPAAATNLTAIPEKEGSTKVAFSFTAPTKTIGGDNLTGNLSIEMTVDGDIFDIRDAQPGETVTTSSMAFPRGLRTLKVTASNDNGAGEVAAIMFFAGYDVPAAVKDLTLTSNDKTATVTWTAPTEGAEGGAIRTPLTYDVIRMPGDVTVATAISETTFSETLTSPAKYYYTVIPSSQDGKGIAASSNGMIIGNFEIPYYCGFDTQGEYDMYTVIDLQSEGKVWEYDVENQRLRHPWSLRGVIDDYIVTPGLNLSGAKSYEFSFDGYQMVESYPEHIMLYFGPSMDINEMKLVLDTGQLPTEAQRYSGVVAPPADGIYYFALRSKTGNNGFMSYADNIRVSDKGSSAVPAAVSDFKAEAAANGELAIKLTMTAPSTTIGGAPLNAISHIDIIRGEGNEPIKTFDNPKPGKALEWTDTSVKTGSYTYRVIVYSASGAGEPVSATTFAGIDVPGAPTDINADGTDGNRKITWTAPARGANGGNLEGLLSYRLSRVVNDETTVLADNYTETEYTDTWEADRQAFVYYTVAAVTSAGESEAVASTSFAVGDPYPIPYKESFAGGKTETQPWSVEQVAGYMGTWEIEQQGDQPYIKAQDGDDGLATFDGYHSWTKDCELRLISPAIDISKYIDPELSFYFYHYNGLPGWWQEEPDPVNETMCVEISMDGGPFQVIPNSDITLYAADSSWKQYKFDLANYRKCTSVRIAFRGKGAGCANIHIDNIAVNGTIIDEKVDLIGADNGSVTGDKGGIRFSGLTHGITVYDTAGRKVAARCSEQGFIALPSGVYIAVSGNEKQKTIVK